MKTFIRFFVLFALVLQLASGSLPRTSAQKDQPLEGDNLPAAPAGNEDGMPGWPVPDKPIPQHEPGAPSRAASYSTQVTRLNAEGVEELVTLTGLEAMLADGVIDDPLAGNYRLVGKEDIALGIYDIVDYNIQLDTYTYDENEEILDVVGSTVQLAAAGVQHQSFDLAAGDLNGDGVDEQIAAWVDGGNRHIKLAIGEMPGTDGRSSSEPAAAAYVAYGGDQVGLLVRGYDQALWYTHYNGTTWGEWNNDGGGLLLSGPAIASRGSYFIDVFAVGTDNQVWRRSRFINWIGGWTGLPVDTVFPTVPAWIGSPPELEAPAAVARGTNELDVFRVAPDRTLRWSHFNGSSWSSWSGLGGMFASGPGAVLLGDGSIQVFATGLDQSMWYLHSMGTGWEMDGPAYNWQRVELDGMDQGVRPISAPSAVRLPTGEIRVFVRASDDALWQVTCDGGAWGAWSKGVADLASRPAVAVTNSGLALFGLAANGSLQYSSGGTAWEEEWDQHWLPACCLGTPIDTGIIAYATSSTNPVDKLNLLDIETGHFLGDGRRQIALAYTWDNGSGQLGATGIGLRLFDVNNGFRTLNMLGGIDDALHEEDYYPKIAVGEFDGDAPQEIALAYATRRGGVRVYEDNFTGTQIAWLKPRIPNPQKGDQGSWYNLWEEQSDNPFYGTDMNNQISSIRVAPGWIVCVKDQWALDDVCWRNDVEPIEEPYKEVDENDLGSLDDEISWVYVNGPGSSNFIVDVTDGYTPQRNAYVALEIFDIDPQAPTPVSQAVDYFELVFTDTDDYPAPERTLGIAAGDFDGTRNDRGQLNDEIALLWDKVCRGNDCQNYRAYLHILDVEMVPGGMSISDHRNIEIEKFHLQEEDPLYPYSAEINLTVGDLDGDSKDEIANTWPYLFQGEVWANMKPELQVWDWETGWMTPTTLVLPDSSYHTYEDALVAGDLDQDLQDEIVYNEAGPDNVVRVYSFTPEGIVLNDSRSFDNPLSNVFVLATGDFTGEGIRVGPPTYRVQEQMTTPVAFINLPPMHRDIIDIGGTDTEITIGEGLYATHSAGNSTEEWSSVESKRDWSLSTGIETSVGSFGHTVEASMNNTYSEDFSNTEGTISSITYRNTTTADLYDQLLVNQTSYRVWEYPVIGLEGEGPDLPKTIAVTWPIVETTNTPATKKGQLCDENFYTPRHQIYNVWSYDPEGSVRFGDYEGGRELHHSSSTGGTNIELVMTGTSEEERTSSFQNQISAGMSYSYENELNIPLVGKAWDFSFRAYAEGSYGFGKISNFGTRFTEESQVVIDIPSPPASAYEIWAYLYWASGGYLVVDYLTGPEPEGAWLLYSDPDPAFTLPWYGFPDTAGNFPPIPDPDAPPCGPDKQLFSHDIELDPAYVQNGETVTMTATLRNFSNEPLSNVTVRFYLGEPVGGSAIGECSITSLDRNLGPKQCSDQWVVTGASGEEKVYAVIDPNHSIEEMHDEGDPIDNNVGYGLLNVANADYFDPGLRQGQVYQAILYEQAPGLGFGLYLPTANMTETVRYELVPTTIPGLNSIGGPVQVLAFRGGEQDFEGQHNFGEIPAGIVATYRDEDLNGTDEADLKLYRQVGTNWVEATCPGYQVVRFPDDNRLAVPICQAGTFALSTEADLPTLNYLYLPITVKLP